MKISKALAQHAVDELLQMGYTAVGDELFPPERLSEFACKFFGVAALTQGTGEAVEPVATEVLAESEDGEHIIIACGEVDYRCSCGQWRASFATITPAMIDWQEHVKTGHTLPLDYLAGHADALAWAAEVAEASDQRTGDWLYDDRNDLANALRKGPEMPPAAPAPPAQQLQQAVARAVEEAEKRMLTHISKVIWVERDRHVTLLGKCIAQGDKERADTYEQIARALDELHEGIQP